jgi:hypothetical protein
MLSRGTAAALRLCRGCARGLAGVAQGAGRQQGAADLKSLRRLYKLVHPDLFTDLPREQAVNQKSFALLQEWLALASATREPHGRSRSFHFEFYIRPVDDDDGDGDVDEDEERQAPAAPLRHVALSLPPPGRSLNADATSMSPATALALGKLLSAVGIQDTLAADACLDAQAERSLLDFLPEATEALRQAESSARSADDVVRMARAALRMTRGIMLSFADGAPADAAGRAHLAQELARALDATPEGFMRGCALVLGDRFGVDPGTGAVWLDCRTAAAKSSWHSRLLAVDVLSALAAKTAAGARREVEAGLATRVGVAVICAAEAGLGASPSYASFLRNLDATCAARGPVAGGSLTDVPVRVGPAASGPGQVVTEGYDMSLADGVLTVPITATGDDVYAFLAHAGPSAAAVRHRLLAAEQRAAEAGAQARRMLRMRHLLRGDGVSPDAFTGAVARLVAARRQLAQQVEGLSMRIVAAGTRLGMSADAQYLEVPADFTLQQTHGR